MGLPCTDIPQSSNTQESESKALLQDVSESEMFNGQLGESQHLDETHLDDENHETNPIASPPHVSASIATAFEQLAIDNEENLESLPTEEELYTSAGSHFMFGNYGSGIGSGQARDFYGEVEEQPRYTSSLPNNMLPSDIEGARYNTATPYSLSGPALAEYEVQAQRAGQQVETVARHLALNPYSHQPEMPIEHYPSMQQCYMPSAFQQAYPAGNHQSLAAMLPQYKTQSNVRGGTASSSNFPLNPSSVADPYEDLLRLQLNGMASSLQQPQFDLQNQNSPSRHQRQEQNSPVVYASPSSAYGNSHENSPYWHQRQEQNSRVVHSSPSSAYVFGGGPASSSNFPLNPSGAANSHETSPSWHQRQQHNSRVVPGSEYYSFQGHQNQQHLGNRQNQQQLQHQNLSQQQHQNLYHSPAAMSLEDGQRQRQQQQNDRDPSKQTEQHLWSKKY